MIKMLALFKFTLLGSLLAGVYLLLGTATYIYAFIYDGIGGGIFSKGSLELFFITLPWSGFIDEVSFVHEHQILENILYAVLILLNTAIIYYIGRLFTTHKYGWLAVIAVFIIFIFYFILYHPF